jgi:hypothetical protein
MIGPMQDSILDHILPSIFLVNRLDNHVVPVHVNKQTPFAHALCMFCMQTLYCVLGENITLIIL